MKARDRQRGSALLIVFVFAAVIAILLYREMPVVAFEAQRQKEELLIDRGDEYKHAVKLFVRKTGTFPPSIEALENTNRMRFLRHKFDDPFTGKDDWRLLHAGPGGMIVDSKVKTNSKVDANGKPVEGSAAASNPSASPGFASQGFASQGFGQSSKQASNQGFTAFGGSGSNSDSSTTAPEATVAPIQQRPPAIPVNRGDLSGTPGEAGQPAIGTATQPLGQPGDSLVQPNNIHSPEGVIVPENAAAPSAPAGNASQDPQAVLRSLLNRPQNPPAAQQQQNSRRTGTIISGGIAGVASKASGHSIKLVNDQDNYSLWEFYYDMTKDANKALAAAQGSISRTGNPAANSPTSGFGPSSTFSSSKGFSLSNSNNSTAGPGPPPGIGQPVQNSQPGPNQ